MRTRIPFVLLALFTLTGSPSAGEKAPDKPRRIEGELKADDPRDPVTKNPRQVHSVKLRGGQLYDIRLDAVDKDLDPFLRVEDAAGKELGRDDDSGGALNARLLFLAPKDGDYKLIVTAYKGTGKYLLRAAESEEKIHVVGKDGLKIEGKIEKTDPPLAALKGAPHKVFLVRLEAGQSYLFDLRSKEFDTLLIVEATPGKVVAYDDDGGEGTNSRLKWTPPAENVYRLIVAALDRKPGSFVFLVRSATPTVEERLLLEAKDLTRVAEKLRATLKYGEALEKDYRALDIRCRILGDEHVDTSASHNNVALDLDGQGKYEQAEAGHRKALAICRKVLGEEHRDTATVYACLATNLHFQGKYKEAEGNHRRALATYRKVLGEEHVHTATTHRLLAATLEKLDRYTEAEAGYRKALIIRQRVFGEEHLTTATSYDDIAGNLHYQGRYAEADEAFRKVLMIRRKALGDGELGTAKSYIGVAVNLYFQGKYAESDEGFRKALGIIRMLLGEDNEDTATAYGGMAANLRAQGRYVEAEEAFGKALGIRCKTLGNDHPKTATSFSDVASNLHSQGRYTEADKGLRAALTIRRRVFGEEHSDTAESYANLATNANSLGLYTEADKGYRKALAIYCKVLGEEHSRTASTYGRIGSNLNDEGKYAEAEESLRKATTILRKVLGEAHPDTATSYKDLAVALSAQGKHAEAEKFAQLATQAFFVVRGHFARSGLERALGASKSPSPLYVALLVRSGRTAQGWAALEADLGRGVWDDASSNATCSPTERAKRAGLIAHATRLEQLIAETFSGKGPEAERKKRREDLLAAQLKVQGELADHVREMEAKYGPIAGEVFALSAIQASLPADTALVGWLDLEAPPKAADPNGDHLAFVLRAKGDPIVVRLSGTGAKDGWLPDDSKLPGELRAALLNPAADWRSLAKRLSAQRLGPLAKHLAATGDLPAAKHLVVLPSEYLAGIPVEAFAEGYTVSYAPSGTMYAYLRKKEAGPAAGLLALADPVFERDRKATAPAPLPPGGLLVVNVPAGSNAALAGLVSGDVLLRYAGADLKTVANLDAAIAAHDKDKRVEVVVWRDGVTNTRDVQPGKLGAVLAKEPAPIALAEKRKTDDWLAARGSRDDKWAALPGTRVEADRLTKLFGKDSKVLMESDASEQALHDVASKGELEKFRYIHLATHGTIDYRFPMRSAVILSRDKLPDPGKQLDAGLPVFDGRLTAEKVLRDWKLNADLVTLSACETALAAKFEGGEGYVGFSQALILAGSRSVCLSLWKVDDTATALLMDRFYQNLLGKRDGLKAPLGKAAALAEAKNWLRYLTRSDALKRTADLLDGVPRGKHATGPLLLAPKTPSTPTMEDRPYAHPYYWAAFVLIGNPD
ncbi:MAG: tetratricopeptide repeat protein [Gemmataceae bacterium]